MAVCWPASTSPPTWAPARRTTTSAPPPLPPSPPLHPSASSRCQLTSVQLWSSRSLTPPSPSTSTTTSGLRSLLSVFVSADLLESVSAAAAGQTQRCLSAGCETMTQHKRLMWLYLPAEQFWLRRDVSAACLSCLSNLCDVNVPVRTGWISDPQQNLPGSVPLGKQEPAVTHLHVNQKQTDYSVLLRDKNQTHFRAMFLSCRMYPDHLLCAAPPSRPALRPENQRDQDSLSSSNCSCVALGSAFSTDRYRTVWL